MVSAESPANYGLQEVEAPRAEMGGTTSTTEVATEELLGLLYRQLRRLAGPRPDLDDIVQAAAERALKSLPRFEGRAQLSTWTYGVAYRTLLDHDRWYARFKRRFIHA